MKSNSKANSRRKVFAVVALNVYSGQRKLAGITRFFNERLPREEDKWDLDILHGHDALTDAAMRLAVREGVSGIILLDYPAEATVSLVARSGIPCVVETSDAQCAMHNAQCTMHNAECRMQNAECEEADKRNFVRIVCDARELAREAAQNLVVRQSFASCG